MLDNSTFQENLKSELKPNHKTAIILIPGFRSKHLAYGVWNQLKHHKNAKFLTSHDKYNFIDDDSLKSQDFLHIYEINWSEITYSDKTQNNQFYQANLTLKVLLNFLTSIFYLIYNSLYFSPLCKNSSLESEQYWRFFFSVVTAFLLPIAMILFLIISIALLLVNLTVACLTIYSFIKDAGTDFIEKIIEFPRFIFSSLSLIFNYLSEMISNLIENIINFFEMLHLLSFSLSGNQIDTDYLAKIFLSLLLILIWVAAIGFNSQNKKILELANFTNDYCQNEFLRLKIRKENLKPINSIILDSNYEEIVIISHSFGTLLAIDLLANITSSKNIKHISCGNIIGVTGIIYFDFIYNIVEKNKQYDWTDYYAWFDFFATPLPISNIEKSKNLSQKCVGYDYKNLLSLFTSKYHLVYFMKNAYVKKCQESSTKLSSNVKDHSKRLSPLQEILADYDTHSGNLS